MGPEHLEEPILFVPVRMTLRLNGVAVAGYLAGVGAFFEFFGAFDRYPDAVQASSQTKRFMVPMRLAKPILVPAPQGGFLFPALRNAFLLDF